MKNIGGQAVIEGVMMKSPRAWTVAVRGPNREICFQRNNLKELPKLLKKPVIRGFVTLTQALVIGIKALAFSAEKAIEEEEEKPSSFSMGITVFISIALGLGLFLLLPLYCTKLLGAVFQSVNDSRMLFNLVDGIIRIIFFLIYIISINASRDIRRVFQYHGAEHKVVHAYEAGSELTPENVEPYSILHPRCGTSFLLVVMVFSIMTFSFIPKELPLMGKFLSRIIFIPLIAGCSYEFIRFSSKRISNPFIKAMAAPGLYLQRLTALEPSQDQIEVAIEAMREVLKMESEGTAEK
ncbi:MAG: DUF1385 domain-containing protein [Nitrospirae bacterium]|nr:DUF1385 domain-containing protein [Nitrospirota bacterium]